MGEIAPVTMPVTDSGNDPADNIGNEDFKQAVLSDVHPDPLAWTELFKPDRAQLEKWGNPEWVYPDLIIEGHVVSIHADANGGKTTILMHLSEKMAETHKVIYVNADVSGSDALRYEEMADRAKFELLLPDFMPGQSMSTVKQRLEEMNCQEVDLHGTVWIFDTFKKLTDVIQKRQVKDLMVMLRGLCAKGATIVLLAHNNKHKDEQGNSVYEGTGDVRSDVDELIFLNHIKNEDGSMTVTTKPDKVRGDFMPISFRLGKDRVVTQLDATIDVQKTILVEKHLTKDREAIDIITDFLRDTSANQTEILKHCAAQFALSRRAVTKVLDRYCGGGQSRWTRVKGEKNARVYTLDSRSP